MSGRLPHQKHSDGDYVPEYLAVEVFPIEDTAGEHAHMNEVLRVVANVLNPGFFNVHWVELGVGKDASKTTCISAGQLGDLRDEYVQRGLRVDREVHAFNVRVSTRGVPELSVARLAGCKNS